MSWQSDAEVVKKMVEISPKLKRGKVWCIECGRSVKVDSVECLSDGWPECHGQTMTVDAPSERNSNEPLQVS